jgi:hypothetical protein
MILDFKYLILFVQIIKCLNKFNNNKKILPKQKNGTDNKILNKNFLMQLKLLTKMAMMILTLKF